MNMIPTARKGKLPKGFSYPLGARAISAALDDIPQRENATLWFSWRDEYWASRWRKKIEALGDVTLLEITDSYSGQGRDLRVYAVPSQYSVVARTYLLAELKRVRRELLAARVASNHQGVSVKLSLSAAMKPDKKASEKNIRQTSPIRQ